MSGTNQNDTICEALIKDDHLLGFAAASAVSGIIALYCESLFFSTIAICLIDGYLLLVLFAAAVRSDAKHRFLKGGNKSFMYCLFPRRISSFLMVILFFSALVMSFAAIYLCLAQSEKFGRDPVPNISGCLDALYFSLVTISTVGFGDYAPSDPPGKLAVMAEILSGILLFIGAFPLLISRIADFGSESETEEEKLAVAYAKIDEIGAAINDLKDDNNRTALKSKLRELGDT
jgi:hypothetical protein